jgi:hypothetical protein
VEVYRRFIGACCLHHRPDNQSSKHIALMMETANTSETSVNFYQTTRRNIPEDIHLRTRCRENLKFCLTLQLLQALQIVPLVALRFIYLFIYLFNLLYFSVCCR